MIRRYLEKRDNPWELLAVASLFFLPGLALIIHKGPVLIVSAGNRARVYHTPLTQGEAHFFGWWAISVGAACAVLYFYARRSILRDEAAPPPHFLELDASPGATLRPARKLLYDRPTAEIHSRPHSVTDALPTDSLHLATFGSIGRHVVNIVSGLYLALSIANAIGRFVPGLRLGTFVVLAVSWLLAGVAVIIRELHGNRDSLVTLGIGMLPPVIVGSAVVVLLARIVSYYEPGPGGLWIIVLEWGLFFWVGGYLLVMRDAYHKQKLEEDLASKPTESSSQTLQPTAANRLKFP